MSSVSVTTGSSPVLLATARVIIEAPSGRALAVRALLDQGSEVTLITKRLAQNLRLQRVKTATTISVVGCSNVGICRHVAFIKIIPRNRRGPTLSTLFILLALTNYNPRCSRSVHECSHLCNLQLADDDPSGSDPIDIILGADVYSRIILNGIRKGAAGQPIA